MGKKLNDIGIEVNHILTVSDNAIEIKKALDYALKDSSLILVTGGLGPTKDDITKKTLTEYFDGELILNETIFELLKKYMESRGRPLLESTKQLAYMPSNADVIFNKKGTAAGMWWEREGGKIIVSMPGVPYEMKAMMEEKVLPEFENRFSNETIIHRTIMTAGLGESIIAEKIKDIENGLPDSIKLAYLPNLGVVKLRLTARGTDEAWLKSEIARIEKTIIEILPKYHYGFEDQSIASAVQELFVDKGLKLACAESCTGGQISAQLVQIPGSSAYFKGSVVAYDYDIKYNLLKVSQNTIEEKGAVSAEVVEAMAKSARELLNADYGIGVSGIAGPGGGTEDKPVGTVWLGFSAKDRLSSKVIRLPLDRVKNIQMTSNYALHLLLRFVNGENFDS